MKIGYGSNSGFRDLGIEGILPVVSFCVERSIIIDRAQRFHQSEIRDLKSQIITRDVIGINNLRYQ